MTSGVRRVVAVALAGMLLTAVRSAAHHEILGKFDDTKKITLAPKDGYGDVDPKAVKEVPIDQIPEPARKVDAVLIGVDAEGNQWPVRVQAVGYWYLGVPSSPVNYNTARIALDNLGSAS